MRTWAYLRTIGCDQSGYIKERSAKSASVLGISQSTFTRHRRKLLEYGFLDKKRKHYHVRGIAYIVAENEIVSSRAHFIPLDVIIDEHEFEAKVVSLYLAQQTKGHKHQIAEKKQRLDPKGGHRKAYLEQCSKDKISGIFSRGEFSYTLLAEKLGIGRSIIARAIRTAEERGWLKVNRQSRTVPIHEEHITCLRKAYPDQLFKWEKFEAFGAELIRVVHVLPNEYTIPLEGFCKRRRIKKLAI